MNPCKKCGATDRYKNGACRPCSIQHMRDIRTSLGIEEVRKQARQYRSDNINRSLFWAAKKRAKTKGIHFSIELEDVIIPKICPVLGLEISLHNKKQANNSPTLDRIDNSLGYVKGNVWVISWRANNIKSNATLEELSCLVNALNKLKAIS